MDIQILRRLPEEIIHHIFSYTHRLQSTALLQDIKNFHITKEILLKDICENKRENLISVILEFYQLFFLYKNSNPYVVKNLKKWFKNHTTVKKYDNVIIIELADELTFFNHVNKWLYLWAILDPINRNKYLNFLYSIYNI